ncbi:MAG: ABC transporter permease, partial [Anaerolineae bacterium]
MSLSRTLSVLRKDLRIGPRSPMFLYALVFPVLATLLFQGVFGGLFDAPPRLGIVDRGNSEIAHAAEDLEGVEVTDYSSVRQMKDEVESNDLDAGLVLDRGFDDALLEGENPELEMYFSGESKASNRVILAT